LFMDKFATLEPVRLYASNTGVRLFSRGTASNKDSIDGAIPQALVGSLPSSLHIIIVYHLPIPDIATYSICSRATRLCAAHDLVWEKRWKALGGIDNDPVLHNILEHLQRKTNEKPAAALPVDDFGDFTTAELYSPSSPDVMHDFSGAFQNLQLSAQPTSLSYSHTNESYKNKYIRVHNLLKTLTRILLSPPQLILSQLAEQVGLSLYHEAKLLRLLSHFLSPDVKPLRRWESLYLSLRSAMDRFDSNLLSAFDVADGKGDEEGMKEAAASSWELWDKSSADWEMGKVWAEKKEIFYQQGKWKALDNFT
jgi:recyclin-1